MTVHLRLFMMKVDTRSKTLNFYSWTKGFWCIELIVLATHTTHLRYADKFCKEFKLQLQDTLKLHSYFLLKVGGMLAPGPPSHAVTPLSSIFQSLYYMKSLYYTLEVLFSMCMSVLCRSGLHCLRIY